MIVLNGKKERICCILAAVAFAVPCSAQVAPNDGMQESQAISPIAREAMVVSAHPEASRVGVAVLREGGNAIDAAVAVGFALAVVSPDAGNIGGGGFLLVRFEGGETASLNFRERAPLAATRDMYLDANGEIVEGRSITGPLAVGVPGTVAGLLEAHSRYGSLPLQRLIQPAIDLAEEQRLTERNAMLFNRYTTDFLTFPSTARVFVKRNRRRFEEGEIFRQPELAETLRRIRDNGRDGFYRGRTADLIVEQIRRSGGLITHEDLERYEPAWQDPVTGSYRGHRVISMGPPSSGGVALLQVLKAIEPYPLQEYGFRDARAVHLVGEALRRAFADRAHWLGDPDFEEVPVAMLLDPERIAMRMASFDPERVSSSLELVRGELSSQPLESTETTHYSVVDPEGNAVAVTTTLNGYYGSKLVVDGAGFFLNNEMDDFTAAPGQPNEWGLIQGAVNEVEPGKRMVSSMTPTIVESPEGELFMVAGSAGGPRIISTVLQLLTNVIDFGLEAQLAVKFPRFHHQWLPDELVYEGLPNATRSGLRERGWDLEAVSDFGSANIIVRRTHPDGSETLEGGADPRRTDNSAVGF